ncbi:MAG: penicillin-binding protein [Actinomycetia bacterium]|nr:penicillin-binding protein [Actinomycetes bacterium]
MKFRRNRQSAQVSGATLMPALFSEPGGGRARRDRRFSWGIFVALAFVAAAIFPMLLMGVTGTKATVQVWEDLPVEIPDVSGVPERSQLLDRNGKVFATFSTTNRVSIAREEIPDVMVNAIVAVEDAEFFTHSGVDFKAIVRAMFNNASGGDTQGASTITQQWVKNVLATTAENSADAEAAVEQTLKRKLREAKLAMVADGGAFSKEDILTGYLNTVYFGDQAYGIYAASKHYFSVKPKDLTLNQAATLAGLVQSPSRLAPTSNKKAATERRNQVLERMQAEGHISTNRMKKEQAKRIKLRVSQPDSGCQNSDFPHYCTYVREALLNDPALGKSKSKRQEVFDRGGLRVTTALDPKAQRAAIAAARAGVGISGDVASAVAVVKPGTPEVVAAATNRVFGAGENQTEIMYADSSLAPLGSNFKPFVLATALELGFPLSTRFGTPDGYYPAGMNAPVGGFHNANRRDNGVLDARGATKGSVNTWFIQLIERTGTKAVADFAGRLGNTTLPRKGDGRITDADATLALGTYNAKPIEVAAGYAAFAAEGVTCTPTPLLKIRHIDGQRIKLDPQSRCYQGTSAAVANSVANILTAPFENGGTASALGLPGGRPAAGKTGTTDNSSATWFTGFTPQYVTTVWVGDPRGGFTYPLRNRWINGSYYDSVFGATLAGPIWKNTMSKLHDGLPVEKLPGLDNSTLTSSIPAVPDLTGLTQTAATAAAERAGFTAVKIKTTEPGERPFATSGLVVRQSPDAGTSSPTVAREEITLTVIE